MFVSIVPCQTECPSRLKLCFPSLRNHDSVADEIPPKIATHVLGNVESVAPPLQARFLVCSPKTAGSGQRQVTESNI